MKLAANLQLSQMVAMSSYCGHTLGAFDAGASSVFEPPGPCFYIFQNSAQRYQDKPSGADEKKIATKTATLLHEPTLVHPFYTIGHSTRSVGEFVDLLRSADVTLVADVRTVPRSRTNPQYNRDVLPQALAPFRIGYEHLAALGGLRGRRPDVQPSVNAFWQNESFHNYADYAMSDNFRSGLARLRELGSTQRCAIMCAEALWWQCHRRIIADYLLSAGETVFHIVGPRNVQAARLTDAAQQHFGILTYPAAAL